ncbi:MAG: SLBB domain-containing protein [Pyrinomonadaceae bacterium]
MKEEDLIHYGDLIEIDVLGSLEHDWRGTITPEGFLSGVDFLEKPVYGLCRSGEEVAKEIAESYGRFLRNPQVVVRILDRSKRPDTVLYGAIKNPQRFRINRPIYLNELIIISGGLTDKASGEVQIFRSQNLNCLSEIKKKEALKGQEPQEKFVTASQDTGSQFINIKISDLLTGKKEANPQIFGGDVITVLEAQAVYVIGGVENPKQISLRSKMTLSRAIASAGGVSKDADESKVTIFRREGTDTSIIEADLDQIKKNKTEDIALQAFDIVEVGRRGKEQRKVPPILENFDAGNKENSKLPLRIID